MVGSNRAEVGGLDGQGGGVAWETIGGELGEGVVTADHLGVAGREMAGAHVWAREGAIATAATTGQHAQRKEEPGAHLSKTVKQRDSWASKHT